MMIKMTTDKIKKQKKKNTMECVDYESNRDDDDDDERKFVVTTLPIQLHQQ